MIFEKINKIDFKISEEHKQVRLQQVNINNILMNLFINSVNKIINLKIKLDEFYGSYKEKIHDFIINLLVGG